MTQYYNINTEQTSSKPTSSRTSNLWLAPELAALEGWLVIVEDVDPALGFGEYVSGFNYVDQGDGTVLQSKVVQQYSLEDYKARLLSNAKSFCEQRMESLHGGIAEQVGRRAGDFGVSAQTSYLDDQTTYLSGFLTFKNEVMAATTWSELESIYNNYPQLQP